MCVFLFLMIINHCVCFASHSHSHQYTHTHSVSHSHKTLFFSAHSRFSLDLFLFFFRKLFIHFPTCISLFFLFCFVRITICMRSAFLKVAFARVRFFSSFCFVYFERESTFFIRLRAAHIVYSFFRY